MNRVFKLCKLSRIHFIQVPKMTLNKDTSAAGGNMYEDFSGISHTPSENPYNALIEACGDDVVSLQSVRICQNLIFTRCKYNHDMKSIERHEIPNKSLSFSLRSFCAWIWILFYTSSSTQHSAQTTLIRGIA